ncbi:hypothetical protein [Streptomyces sp. NPDC054784]
MNMRRTMKARGALTAAVAVTTGLVLTVAGCSGGGDDEPDSKDSSAPAGSDEQDDGGNDDSDSGSDEVLAQVKGGKDITLTIKSATRDDGGFVSVTGTVTNGGGGLWTGIEWKSDEAELAMKNPNSVAAAKLVDKSGKKRYYILRDTEGRCLCTTFKGGLQSNASASWYAQFPAPPKGNDKVDFEIADMPPASITISEG